MSDAAAANKVKRTAEGSGTLATRNPTTSSSKEGDSRLCAVLQLMKLAREKELLRFFQWLAGIPAKELPDNLLGLMLLCALHADSEPESNR